jgi:hypothetical protein
MRGSVPRVSSPDGLKGQTMTAQAQRPASVTGIAWTFIASAVIMLLSGLISLGAGGTIRAMTQQMMAQSPGAAAHLPWQLRIMLGLIEYFTLVTWIQIALSIVALVAGIELLRCRAWARAVLEGLTWLALIATLAVGALWLWGWLSLTPVMPEGLPLTPGLRMTGAAMVAVIVVVGAAPLVFLIRALRRPAVHAAMLG